MAHLTVMGTGKSNGIAVNLKQFFVLELKIKVPQDTSIVNVFSESCK
jgi:hypothetical protein